MRHQGLQGVGQARRCAPPAPLARINSGLWAKRPNQLLSLTLRLARAALGAMEGGVVMGGC